MADRLTIPIQAGWKPDLSDSEILRVGGLKTANNIIPTQGKYLPTYNRASLANLETSSTIALNGFCVQIKTGNYINFLGTSNEIYRFDSSGIYTCGGFSTSTNWNFVEFGDWLIAGNESNDIKVLKDIEAGSFATLSGTPPRARYLLTNNTHLILGYTYWGGAYNSKRLYWCARNDCENWTASLLTGAGNTTLSDMEGIITGLASVGERFAVFGSNSITVGNYVGGLYTFNFKINYCKNVGCFFPKSLISIHDRVFFWSKDSIYMFDGTALTNIGKDICKTVFSDINLSYTERISVAHDRVNNLIMWAYPSSSSTDGTLDKILFYNYMEDRFTTQSLGSTPYPVHCIFMAAMGSVYMDNSYFTNIKIDDLNVLIDANTWFNTNLVPMAGYINTGAIPVKLHIHTFTGTQQTAEIETGEFGELASKHRGLRIYSPLQFSETKSNYGNVTVKTRDNNISSWSSLSAVNFKERGVADVRATASKLKVNIQGNTYSSIENEIPVDGVKM